MRAAFAVLGLIHLVTPLLFFTNLTRNPYYTQIALLNLGIALAVFLWAANAWMSGELVLPRFPFEAPMYVFLAFSLISTVLAWATYNSLRAGIMFEGTRVWSFSLFNGLFALYLPAVFAKPLGSEPKRLSIWTDIVVALLWGAMWLGFHSNRDPNPALLIWDTYGGLLWIMAGVYAIARTRRGLAIEYFHLIFVVSLVAGIYGIMQYAGKDIIWNSPIQPYGGRPVSTFGNPNFLSSYVLLVSPLAFAFGLGAEGKNKSGYFVIALVSAVSVLCTLTRSSYLGLLAAYLAMGAVLVRGDQRVLAKRLLWVALGFVLFLLIFPKTPVNTFQSPLARFTEIYTTMKAGQPYGPWHQRIMIWSSAWDMLHQNLLLGVGWGCFELFYPFFQGKYLWAPVLSGFRTHANNAHNILLEIWSQTGFLGAGAAIWILVTVLVSGWVVVRRQTEGTARLVTAALWGGFVGMIVDNFFGNVSIFFAVPAFLFFWNTGSLFSEGQPRIDRRPLSDAWGRPLLIVIAALCLAQSVYFVKRWKQETFYFSGFKMSKTDNVAKAIKDLELAYEAFPGEVNGNYELANNYARYASMVAGRGMTEEAKKYQAKGADLYRAALDANPGYDEIYFNLGVVKLQMGETELGISYLETALFINPLLRDAYASLGNVYLQRGDIPSAIKVLQTASEAFPRDKDFWNNLGYCYSQLKDHPKAIEAFRKALMVDPGFKPAWQNLAVALRDSHTTDPIVEVPDLIKQMEELLGKKDYPRALAVAQRIATLMPDNADAHLSVGNIYYYLGKLDESEAELKKATALRPEFVIAHVNLGRVYQAKKQYDRAFRSFHTALDFNADDKEAKEALNSLPK